MGLIIIRALLWGLVGFVAGLYIGAPMLAIIHIIISLVVDLIVHLLGKQIALKWRQTLAKG